MSIKFNEFDAVVGLDPSTTSTGVAVMHSNIDPFNPGKVLFSTYRVKSKPDKDPTFKDRHRRMKTIVAQIVDPIRFLGKILVVMEAPAYSSSSPGTFDRYGLWWKIYDALEEIGAVIIPVAPPVRCKYATGKGNADKDTVLAATVKRNPQIDVDGNDIADAVNFLAIGARYLGHEFDGDLPAENLKAMTTVRIE